MGDDLPRGLRAQLERAPGAFLVLTPALHIVAASAAYLAATMTTLEQIHGRYVFDVFPDNPNDTGADGVASVAGSFEAVLRHDRADAMAPLRYDIRRPGGAWAERWWMPVNMPVLTERGRVGFLVHTVEDVTLTRRCSGVRRAVRPCSCTIANPGSEGICRRCGGACNVPPHPGRYLLHDLPPERLRERPAQAEEVETEEVGTEAELPTWAGWEE